jgi:hypothetical protein
MGRGRARRVGGPAVGAALLAALVCVPDAPAAWSSPQALSTDFGDSPFVAIDRRGNAVAVWHAFAKDESNRPLAGSSSADIAERRAGGRFGRAQTVIGGGRPAALAANDRGTAAIAGVQNNECQGGMACTQTLKVAVRSFGQEYREPSEVSDHVSSLGKPAVAIDRRGTVIVVWAAPGPTNNRLRIKVSIRPPRGPFGRARVLSSRAPISGSPAVGMDAKGNAIVAWPALTGGRTPRGDRVVGVEAVYRPAGKAFSRPRSLGHSWGAVTPAVGFDARGDGIVAWSDSTPTPPPVYTGPPEDEPPLNSGNPTVELVRKRKGHGFGSVRRMGNGSRPRLSFGPGTAAAVYWERLSQGVGPFPPPSQAEGAFTRGDHRTFGPVESIGPQNSDAVLDFDGRGDALVLVADDRRGPERAVEAMFRSREGSFGPAAAISSPGGAAPEIDVNRRGTAAAVWLIGGPSRIQGAVFEP